MIGFPTSQKNLRVQSVPIQINPPLSKRMKIKNQHTSQPKALMFVLSSDYPYIPFHLRVMPYKK